MPFIVSGAHYELKVYCYCGGQLGLNVTHGYYDSWVGTPGPTEQEVCDFWSIELAQYYTPLMASGAFFIGTSLQKILPTPMGALVQSILGTQAGSADGQTLPSQVSGIITKRTVLAGRHYRGRLYVPFPANSFVRYAASNEPYPTADYVAGLDAIGLSLLTSRPLDLPSYTPLYHPEVKRSDPTDFTPISGFVSRDKFATQRRRGNYGKVNTLPLA